MTPYALLLSVCGLSQREAADLHGVRIDTVKSWSTGRNGVPASIFDELRELYDRISETAAHAVEFYDSAPASAKIEISYPADDHEAQALGFPCVGAWRAMCAIVVAELWRPVHLVPRGSTIATGAAVQAIGISRVTSRIFAPSSST